MLPAEKKTACCEVCWCLSMDCCFHSSFYLLEHFLSKNHFSTLYNVCKLLLISFVWTIKCQQELVLPVWKKSSSWGLCFHFLCLILTWVDASWSCWICHIDWHHYLDSLLMAARKANQDPVMVLFSNCSSFYFFFFFFTILILYHLQFFID